MLDEWWQPWLGKICSLLWQICYKIEGDKGSQFGLAIGIGWCSWGETISTTSNLQMCEGWIWSCWCISSKKERSSSFEWEANNEYEIKRTRIGLGRSNGQGGRIYFVFEKKKSRISQLDFKMTMF
jgi:hypothetical protein